MNEVNLKYQAAVFVHTNEISPKPETLTYFISEFADKALIPATFQEMGPGGLSERFQMKDSKGIWNIDFSLNRIDIIKTNSNVHVVGMGTLQEFKQEVLNILKIIDSKFPIKSHRLALVVTHFFEDLTEEDFSNSFNKFFKPIPLYEKNPRTEWQSRMVSRIEKEVNGNLELHNFITEVRRTNGTLNIDSSLKEVERLQVKLDINTYQGNDENRFQLEDMVSFFDAVIKYELDLRKELNIGSL